mgnify:CR=1 FL=1
MQRRRFVSYFPKVNRSLVCANDKINASKGVLTYRLRKAKEKAARPDAGSPLTVSRIVGNNIHIIG